MSDTPTSSVRRAPVASLMQSTRSILTPLKTTSLRTLWVALVVSEIGDWAARLALSLLVYQQTKSSLAATAVTTLTLLPWFGIGQYLSTFADRYPHKYVMIISALVRGIIFAALAGFSLPIWMVFVLAFVAGCGDPPFDAARSAMLPQLAKDSYLPTLTLMNATTKLTTLLGFAFGGVLIVATSTHLALGINAVTFFVCTLLVITLPRTSAHDGNEEGSSEQEQEAPSALGGWSLLKMGASVLVKDRFILIGATVVTISALGGISAESLLVPYGQFLHLSEQGIGLLATIMPAAALVAATLMPTSDNHRYLLRWVCWSTAGVALGAGVLFAFSTSLLLAIPALILAGTLDLTTIPAGAVIGTRLPARARASAFSVLQGSLQSVQALGALGAGVLADHVGIPYALSLMSLPGVAAGAVGLLALRGAGEQAVSIPKEEHDVDRQYWADPSDWADVDFS